MITRPKPVTNRLIYLLLSIVVLAGCSPMVGGGQVDVAAKVVLDSGHSVGQTFVAGNDGLSGVQVYLAPGTAGGGNVSLYLRNDPSSVENLGVARMPLDAVTDARFYRFDFASQPHSRRQYYYVLLEVEGEGSLQVGHSWAGTYLDGALYKAGQPGEAQMAFTLVYDPGQALWGVVRQGVTWIGILGVGAFLFILPGWGLLGMLWAGWGEEDWASKTALAGGVSLAVYPLLFLWTDVVGVHMGVVYAWLPPLLGLVVIGWRNREKLRHAPQILRETFGRLRKPGSVLVEVASWSGVVLVLALVLVVATRMWVIRGLDMPMWGDSYQHTLIAQLLVDNDGLFDSWKPYADLETFTYHFGYHTLVAVFHWVTRLAAPRAVLWVGQLLNILAVLGLYPLAVRIGKSRWAGVGAVLVAGLIVPMPMTYVNWGRYTQLAGQVILPVIVLLAWDWLEESDRDWKFLALIWVVLAGLALTHYRVLIYGLLFLPAFFIMEVRGRGFRTLMVRIFWLGLGSVLLFMPWFLRVYAAQLMNTLVSQLTTPAQALPKTTQTYNAIGNLFVYLPGWVWLSLPLIIGWGLWQRRRSIGLVGLWWFLVLLATNPNWLNLPGAGALTNFAMFIAAYIPAGIFVGAALGWGVGFLEEGPGVVKRVANPGWLVILVAAGMWGAGQRLSDVNISWHALVTRPDQHAAAWIRENTPQESRFLVNSFFAYEGTVVVGSDGGWWLPLLAERKTSLPPLTYGIEEGVSADNITWTNELTRDIQDKGVTHPEVLSRLNERGITHVYIGQRHGRVNYGGEHILKAEELLNNGNFKLIYHRDRVWIFEIMP